MHLEVDCGVSSFIWKTCNSCVGTQYVPLVSERARQVFETAGFFHSFQTTGKIVEYMLNLPE